MSAPEPRPARLFFAVWPDAAGAAVLHEAAQGLAGRCGGRVMRRETLHLTLAFLGPVAAAKATRLDDVGARALEVPAFALDLDRLGWWRHNRIVWAGASVVPPALAELAAGLGDVLAAAGFAVERRPFVPHVTLLRKAGEGPRQPEMAAIRWPVSELVLVRSQPSAAGAAYERLAAWPLAHPSAQARA